MKTKSILIAGFAACIMLASCGKKKITSGVEMSEDNSTADNMFSDVFTEVDNTTNEVEDEQLKTGAWKSGNIMVDSAEIILVEIDTVPGTQAVYAKEFLIDYGTGTTVRNRTRKGIIRVKLSGPWRTVNTVATITLEDFFISDHKIEGTKIITTTDYTVQTGLISVTRTVEVRDAKVTTPDGDVITWEANRTVVASIETTGIFVKITGGSSGVGRNGNDFTVLITEELVAKFGCAHFISGVFTVTSTSLNKTVSVDLGDGTCDNKAMVTVGKRKPREITLR